MIFTALRMVSLAPNQEHDLRQWSQARMLYLGQKQKGFDTLVALTEGVSQLVKLNGAKLFQIGVEAATQLWIEAGAKDLGCLACE
jgi:hypothetical protein